jgi:hypothetical protein
MLRLSTASGSKRRVGNPENAGTFLNTPNEKLYSVYSDIAKLTPLGPRLGISRCARARSWPLSSCQRNDDRMTRRNWVGTRAW